MQKIKKSQIGLNEALSIQQDAIMSRLNCHNIGKIIKFYPETQTADIQIMLPQQVDGMPIFPSLLSDIPLIIYGTGDASITLPNPEDTTCLLLFIDRDIDKFMLTNEMYEPATSRMHDFTDCVALTTFTTLANPMVDYDTEAITLIHQKIIEEVKKQSYIKIYPDRIELKNIQGEAAQGLISIGEKINIGNNTQNLANLIQAFLTACENIAVVTNTGVLTPAAKQAFTDLKTKFGELLN